ncbi:uncharacterized protein LOC127711329 [Mytilus californianus]|uniref:uncharacterized protein LOC127711329 n=1 Tax=Mytilus californianus TaxID=6549 RepID=UPI002246B8EF|nr:uncharacterized protein LOC127711329 [Mytilus californianus]
MDMASSDMKPDTSDISLRTSTETNNDVLQHGSIELNGVAVQTEVHKDKDKVSKSNKSTEIQSLSSSNIGQPQQGLPLHLDKVAHITVLDKHVLDNLISKCIIMIEDREEIIKPTTQFERNKVLLEILTERPYDNFQPCKDTLIQLDQCNSDVQELFNRMKIRVKSEEPSSLSQTEIIVNTNTIKLQKNYNVLVHDMDCTTDVVDHLLQSEVLEPEDREEICTLNLTKQESNRRLLAKLVCKDENVYNMFLGALRYASYEQIVDDLENTEVTTHDKELCQIGMVKFRERQRMKEQGQDMISQVNKNLKKIQSELHEVIPGNIRAQMRLQIEDWVLKDRSFVFTRASEHVRNCVLDNNCVTITGSAGVGKTFISRHVALILQKDRYIIIPVTESTDIRNYYQPGLKTVFVVDDICGKFTASQQQIEKWQQLLPVIKTILEDKCCKIIVTCRLQVYKDRQFGVLSRPFKSCECNLTSDELRLTGSEKTKMAESYFGKYADELDLTEVSEQSFPLLCSLCRRKPDMDVQMFFKRPFEMYKNELDKLYCSGNQGLMEICSLVMIVLYNNKLDGEIFTGEIADEQRKLLDDTFEACELNRGTSRMKLKVAADTLVGTYISKEINVYSSLHDRLFDFFAHYFGMKMIHLVIKHGDSSFLRERVVWKVTKEDHENDVEFTIRLPDKNLKSYLKRLISDWSDGKVTNVFYNDSMRIPEFRQHLLHNLAQMNQSQRNDLANKKDNEREDFAAGNTPFIKACREGYADIVEWLLSNNGNVNVSRANGVTPLYMAAQNGRTDIVRMLLKNNANVNLSNNAGGTPLRMASQKNHIDVVRLLIEHNADINAQMYDGDNPLLTATRNGFADIVELLLAKRADCNKCLQSKQLIVDSIAKHPPKKIKSVQQSWLNVANKYGTLVTIEFVKNAVPEHVFGMFAGSYPLHLASFMGHKNVVKVLLDYNLNVNVTKVDGTTPLFSACEVGHEDIVCLLLERSANIDMQRTDGKSPLDIASDNGHKSIVMILEEHSKK